MSDSMREHDRLRELATRQALQVEVPSSLREELLRDAASAAPGRRKRRIAVGVGLALVAGLAGAGVAALLAEHQPSRPEGGTLCRAAAEIDADATMIAAGTDPINGCADLWRSGALVRAGQPTGAVPELAACIGAGGVVEVFPDLIDCAELNLPAANPVPDEVTEAVIELQQWTVDQINLHGCVEPVVARALAKRELDDLGLDGWTVEIEPGFEGAKCAIAEVITAERRVRIASL